MVSLQTIRRVFIEAFGEFMILLTAVLVVKLNDASLRDLSIIIIFLCIGIFLRIFGNELSYDVMTKKFWKRLFRLTP